ncbi:MAG TPA: DUF5679 domain-containing protein, partial [Roseiflexaceae bacterium]|nr:DUF5679 domain-containing protein [Roseiflexaceae bacterium]
RAAPEAGRPVAPATPPEAVEQAAPGAPADGRPAEPQAGDHPLGTAEGERTVEGFCMRCKQHRTMSDVRITVAANGRRAARGTCPVCGARMSTFLPNRDR